MVLLKPIGAARQKYGYRPLAAWVLPNVNIFDDHVKYVNMGYFKNGVGASLLAIFSSAAQTAGTSSRNGTIVRV